MVIFFLFFFLGMFNFDSSTELFWDTDCNAKHHNSLPSTVTEKIKKNLQKCNWWYIWVFFLNFLSWLFNNMADKIATNIVFSAILLISNTACHIVSTIADSAMLSSILLIIHQYCWQYVYLFVLKIKLIHQNLISDKGGGGVRRSLIFFWQGGRGDRPISDFGWQGGEGGQ